MSSLNVSQAVFEVHGNEELVSKRMNEVVPELKQVNGHKLKHVEQSTTVSTNTVTDTVSISKQGLALSGAETEESNTNIDKLRLSQQNYEGEISGKRKRKFDEEEISSSLKRPVEQNDQGKGISTLAVKQDSTNLMDNVNKILRSSDPFRNFLGFLNINDENGIFQKEGEPVNILA